ncbi:MAG: diguanylate cyclase [Glaciecola sp.]
MIVIVTFSASVLIYSVGYWLLNDLFTDIIATQKQAITDNVKADVAVFDQLLVTLEANWDQELAQSLPQIARYFSNDKVKTQASINDIFISIQQTYDISDIHLINKDLTVFASTHKPEIGLDMSKFSPQYTRYLTGLFNKGEYSSHRLSLSDSDGRLKKYAYYSLPGSDLLVNIDIDVDDRIGKEQNQQLGRYVFGRYVHELISKYDLVEDIDFLLVSEANSWSFFTPGRFIDKGVAQSIFSKGFAESQNGDERYISVKLSGYDVLGFKGVIYIAFNDSVYQNIEQRLSGLLIGVSLFVILVSFSLLHVGARELFLKRFSSLISQIENKKIGDGKTISISGNDELSNLATVINANMMRIEQQQNDNKDLKAQTNTDGLTQIYNRRFLQSQLSVEIKQAQREHQDLAIIMIDVDAFKAYNDTYGHLSGDETLILISSKIAKQLTRPRDFVARYGGEEFICVLPETNIAGAAMLAEKLRHEIEALHIHHSTSPVSDYVTVSAGCTSAKGSIVVDEDNFIQFADSLLYRAKATGRNKVSAEAYIPIYEVQKEV